MEMSPYDGLPTGVPSVETVWPRAFRGLEPVLALGALVLDVHQPVVDQLEEVVIDLVLELEAVHSPHTDVARGGSVVVTLVVGPAPFGVAPVGQVGGAQVFGSSSARVHQAFITQSRFEVTYTVL